MKISIKENLMNAYEVFDILGKTQVKRAAKKAINRTVVTLRKESIPILQKEIKIKSTVLKNYVSVLKAEGRTLNSLHGAVVFKSKGIALINFVKGSKKVIEQKGIAVNKRRKLKAEITPGKVFRIKGGFIQNTAAKGVQVMRKSKTTRSHIIMQTSPSVGQLLLSKTKKHIATTIKTRALYLFNANFITDLKFRMTKDFKRIKDSKKYV